MTLRWDDNREERLTVSADETVYVASTAAGLGLPIGCRTGACATCTGRLERGTVEHRRPPRALADRHRRDGYVLLCVAEPRSDCLIRVDVADELVSNPWK